MKRKIEGIRLVAVLGKSTTPINVRGSEYCTPENMYNISGLIAACGFTKVVSHNAPLTNVGDGTNVLGMYNSNTSSIVNAMQKPKSIIVTAVRVVGGQADTLLNPSTRGLACKDATVTEYHDKSGAIIVGGGRVLGVYCTAKNLLVTSDLTHCADGPSLLAQILAELIKYKAHYKINGSEKIIIPFRKKKVFTRIGKAIMIGLDPEMGILNKKGKFVGSPYTGTEIGRDAGDVVELRPKPGSVKDVIENVRTLYTSMGKTLGKDLRLVSGGGRCIGKSLGGHIHFNIPPNALLTLMLDDFIGKPIQRVTGSERRAGENSYGKLGSIAKKTHGFEYRTPPSFIGKPDMFAGVIAVAYCVASTWKIICNSGKTFEYDVTKANGAHAKSYEQLTYYRRYKKHIDAFLEYVNNDELSMEETDVLAAWAIREAICLEDIVV